MKKVCLLLSLFVILLCTGCDGTNKYLPTGEFELEYVSCYGLEDKEDFPEELKVFDKLKYNLKEITKEEYEQANGENVFIDIHSNEKETKKYLSLEVYVYYMNSDRYEKIEAKNIELFSYDNPYEYDGECTFKINGIDYEGIIDLCFFTYKSGSGPQKIALIFKERKYCILFSEVQ